MLFYFSPEDASAILQIEDFVTKIGLATVLPVLLSLFCGRMLFNGKTQQEQI